MDRGEADVATAGAVFAVLFEMIEECAEEGGVQNLIGCCRLSLRIVAWPSPASPLAKPFDNSNSYP